MGLASQETGPYFRLYNDQRYHQALENRTPVVVFRQAKTAPIRRTEYEGEPTGTGVGIIVRGRGLSYNYPLDFVLMMESNSV